MIMVERFKQLRVAKTLHSGMWKAIGLLVTGSRRREFLNIPGFKGLHVGCGHNVLPGWFNTDLFSSKMVTHLDIKKTLKFPNNCLDALYSEHVIEHLSREVCSQFLREANRMLKPGGILRLVTPDLGFFLKMMADPFKHDAAVYLNWFAGDECTREYAAEMALNVIIGDHGHVHVYSEGILTAELQGAGFVEVKRFPVGESNHPFLFGIEGHGKLSGIGEEINRFESMVLEAVRSDSLNHANY